MTLKAAVIGCGRMGGITLDHVRANLPECWLPLSHAEALNEISGIDLVSVCDLSLSTATAVAATLGNIPAYDDHQKMLAEHQPDIVGIATRTQERESIILDCFAAGVKAIHAEKPLALSMAATDRILDAAKAHNALITIGTVRRFMPVYQHCLNLIRDGVVGSVDQVVVEHGHDLLFWGHPHSMDLMIMMLQSSNIVSVQSSPRHDYRIDFKDNILDADPLVDAVTVRFDNGKTGIITSGLGCNLRINGTTGTLTVCHDGEHIELCRKLDSGYLSAPETIVVEDKTSGTKSAFLHLHNRLKGQQKAAQSPAEIRAVQESLMCCAWSHIIDGKPASPGDVPVGFSVTGKFNDHYP